MVGTVVAMLVLEVEEILRRRTRECIDPSALRQIPGLGDCKQSGFEDFTVTNNLLIDRVNVSASTSYAMMNWC